MTSKITVQHKSGLHFEQIPVADVMKKIVPDDRANGRDKGTDGQPAERRRRPRGRARHFHGVQFYKDADGSCRIVGRFIGEGLEDGALGLVIATPDHTARIESCLRGRGVDVDDMKNRGNLVFLDARAMLDVFMLDGTPHPGVFRRTLSTALTRLRRGRDHCTLRAYGEMVDLLWKDGLEAAAIRLETLWNQLANAEDFKLLCGYAMGNFYKGAAIEDIRDQHSHLIGENGDVTDLREVQEESVTAL